MVTVCPSQFATRRTLFHVLVGCGLLMLKVSRLKLPVIWLLVSMWLNTLTKSQIWTNNVFRKFSAFHDETGRLNVDGMNIISNDGSNKLNRSRKARVSYKVQRTINASL